MTADKERRQKQQPKTMTKKQEKQFKKTDEQLVREAANRLEVYIFEPTAGIDQESCNIFNEYTLRLLNTFEQRMEVMSALNLDM